MSQTFFVVRHIPSGGFLPQLRKRRGHSHTEPMPIDQAVPRLHMSKRNAALALHYWLKGKWTEEYGGANDWDGHREYLGNEAIPVAERKREEMEIVPAKVSIT